MKQNFGHMLKTHFKNSQFIFVAQSLAGNPAAPWRDKIKDCTVPANVIFCACWMDGTSSVHRTIPPVAASCIISHWYRYKVWNRRHRKMLMLLLMFQQYHCFQ